MSRTNQYEQFSRRRGGTAFAVGLINVFETNTATTSTIFDGEVEGGGGWSDEPPRLESGAPEVDVQMQSIPAVDPAIYGIESDVHAAAAEGIASPSTRMPHFDRIQQAFGGHDLSSIQAHVGGTSASAMGATAFAAGDHVVFDREPDLHTAAHEAAHVVQQAHGVNLYGGVGEAGDAYEQAADAVADRVVARESAADLLGTPTQMTASPGGAVQRKENLTRDQYTMRADGARGSAISAQLRLAALKINTACETIEGAIAAPVNEMGPQGVMDAIIKPASDSANSVQATLHPIWADMERMKFADRNVREGLGIYNTARSRFGDVQAKIRQWASRNHDPTMDGVNSNGVNRTADFFNQRMGTESTGANALLGKEDPNANAKDLEKSLNMESTLESMGAIEASSQALAMAMRESDPKAVVPGLARRALADLNLLEMNIPNVNSVSDATWSRISSIALVVDQAWIDAQPFGLQGDGALGMARAKMKLVKDSLAKKRKKK
jgi:hypothetical protein